MTKWTTILSDTIEDETGVETWLFQARHSRLDREIQTRWICEGETEAGRDCYRSTTYEETEAIALRDWLLLQYPIPSSGGQTATGRRSPKRKPDKDNFGQMFGTRSMWRNKMPLHAARHQQMTWAQLFESIVLSAIWVNKSRESGEDILSDQQEQVLESVSGEFLRRLYLLLGMKDPLSEQPQSSPTNQ